MSEKDIEEEIESINYKLDCISIKLDAIIAYIGNKEQEHE